MAIERDRDWDFGAPNAMMGDMLPPKKKHANLEDAVTTVVKGSMRPALRSERPEPVSEVEGESADSVTRMMPSRLASEMPPPPSSKPAKSVRPNVSFRPSTEVTTYRPLAAPAAGLPVAASVNDAERVKAQIKAVRAARAAEKAVRDTDSDPRVDPPASTVTAGIVIKGRPTASWAMALVAMGLFGGLLTAVVARGDGDSIVAAGAAFVDPGQAAQITAAHALQPFQPTAAATTPANGAQAPSVMDTSDVIPTVVVAPVADTKVIAKPAPVAAVKPIAPKVTAPAAEKTVAAIAPAPKPVVAAAPPAPKPAAKPKAAANDDMASAAAADALAKAQLESSLK